MSRFRLASVLFLVLHFIPVACSSSNALEEEGGTFVDEASAHALYDQMLEVFRTENAIYLESEYKWGTSDMGLGHLVYKLWMKKPNFARLDVVDQESGLEATLVLDGESFWVFWPKGRPWLERMTRELYEKTRMISYFHWPAPAGWHSILHKVADMQTSMTVSIFEYSTFHGYTDAMLEHLGAVRDLGTEMVDGQLCDVIELSFMEGQRKKKYWISRESHIPLRLEQVIETVPRYITTETWTGIEIGGDIDEDLFDWKPGKDWHEYRDPVLEDGLISPGETAPDFELDLYQGGRFKLSEQRGNVVWLVFWRVGCPPCRVEMPHLEEMHDKYGKKGLRIVGFNCADSRETAEDFFSEFKTSYQTVLDNSAEAKEVFSTRYQRIKGISAVPLNYIIDRDGKVFRAWYGFDDGEHGKEDWLLDILSEKKAGPGLTRDHEQG